MEQIPVPSSLGTKVWWRIRLQNFVTYFEHVVYLRAIASALCPRPALARRTQWSKKL